MNSAKPSKTLIFCPKMIITSKTAPLLLGFGWERRKAELRARLAREFARPIQTVKSRMQIEAEDLHYWVWDYPGSLREKYAKEAEAARGKWAKLDPDGPNGRDLKYRQSRANSSINAPHPVTEAKCDISEGHDSGLPSGLPMCDIVNDLNKSEVRVCKVCGQSFLAARADASLCSARCRKRASRDRTFIIPASND